MNRKAPRNLVVLLFFTLVLFNQESYSQSRDVKKILASLREEEKTCSRGDIEGYVNFYAPLDSTRMILKNGAVYGKQNILSFYKKYWPKEKMGTLKLDNEQLERLSKKYYYVTGNFQVSYADGTTVNGRYSSLMKKINGRWYIYTDHSG